MDKESNLENVNKEEISIGALLRGEREKKGVSRRSLAETIKIREPLIEALENEEWGKLPARVLVKGFIRSYTIAIGYDTRKALKLFEKCVPVKDEDTPKTLIRKTKKGNGIYYIIILLLLIAVAVYLLSNYGKIGNILDSAHQPVIENNASEVKPLSEEPVDTKFEAPAQAAVAPVIDSPDTTLINEPVAQVITNNITDAPADQLDDNSQGNEATPQEDQPAQAITTDVTTTQEEPAVQEAVTPEGPAAMQPVPGKELTATVNARTWVKIVADDTPPKEYIFPPGAKHTWRAERGFDVTIGNAGGIEFFFNGETISNLGGDGEVKKMRFPDDFQTKWEE